METRLLGQFAVSDLLGAPFSVVLEKAVIEHSCRRCGEVVGHTVPDPDELNAVVALLRARNPIKLNGDEIRFLRKSIGWKAKRLAAELRIRPEVLSRFENGKAPMGEVYEQLLRAIVFIRHKDRAPAVDLDISEFLNMKAVSSHDVAKGSSIWLGPAVQSRASDRSSPIKWRTA